ncbi:MAG: hypothetical protein ACQKBT_01725 [Puniceicoccales bacterium]
MKILAFSRELLVQQLARPCVLFTEAEPPEKTHWGERSALEEDPRFLQLIPYALLTGPEGTVWAYRRTGGDPRLAQRRSVGVGGHVDEVDKRQSLLETARAALQRELSEELENPPAVIPELPLGWINEQESAIGRVHIGLVWQIPWTAPALPRPRQGEALASIGFLPQKDITTANHFELWSVLACRLLS